MKDLEGCQYSICCHNDEYQELKKEVASLKKQLRKQSLEAQRYFDMLMEKIEK